MASDKQIEANRKNAQRSTGPITEAGKAISRFNGLEHGMRTRCVDVLPSEDHDAFTKRVNTWLYEMQPSSDVEEFLVRQAAILSWKIDRADRYELSRLAAQINEAVEPWMLGPDSTAIAQSAEDSASFDPSNEGERLRRYQFSLQRALDRVLARLAKIRADEAKGLWGRINLDEDETTEADCEEASPEFEDSADEQSEFSTTEPNFEDLLREAADRFSPTEANSAAVAPVSFSVVPKNMCDRGVKPSQSSVEAFEYLDISCLKS